MRPVPGGARAHHKPARMAEWPLDLLTGMLDAVFTPGTSIRSTCRGTSLIRNSPLPNNHHRTYCRVLGGGRFLCARYPCTIPGQGARTSHGCTHAWLTGCLISLCALHASPPRNRCEPSSESLRALLGIAANLVAGRHAGRRVDPRDLDQQHM